MSIWFINDPQRVFNKVKELKDCIQDIQCDTRQSNLICSRLEEFRGFDAKGFFTLNHSLLTGMAATFVTYMVILIQLRQSEPTDKIGTID